MRRLAIPPANVLIPDSGRDWLGLACTVVLQYDLAPSRTMLPLFATDDSSAYLSGAAELLSITLDAQGQRLRITANTFSLATHRATPVLETQVSNENAVLEPLDRLAHQLDPDHAQPFSTRNPQALQAFVEAVAATTSQARASRLQAAVQLDPKFGLASVALAETVGLPALAAIHPDSFNPFDRARWNALAMRLQQSPREQQLASQQAVLRLAPNNVDALAILGTLQFLAGQTTPGEANLRRAINLNPSNFALQLQLSKLQQAKPAPQAGK